MATFKKLPNNKILGREYVGGGKYIKAVGKTISECKTKLRKIIVDFEENKEKKSSATVKEVLQLFVESKSKILSPSTLAFTALSAVTSLMAVGAAYTSSGSLRRL